jgi:predicted ester cyclase
MRGTHKGDLMGVPPTGKPISMSGTSIIRVAGGKIVESWAHPDFLGMFRQLGVSPPLANG